MKGIPERLRSRARQWGELWGVPHLADSVTVEFSPRFRSSLGLCRPVEGRVRLAANLAAAHVQGDERAWLSSMRSGKQDWGKRGSLSPG